MDFTTMSNDELTAALTEARTKAAALFALDAPTVADADTAEALMASVSAIEGEQATRAAVVADAEARFAAARATFAVNDGVDSGADEPTNEPDGDEPEDGEPEPEFSDDAPEAVAPEADAPEATVTASGAQRIKPGSAAKKVAARTKRPAVKAAEPVIITAAADVQGFAAGQTLSGMDEVAKAVVNRVKGFGKFNQRAAEAVNSQSGGEPVLSKFGAASFSLNFDDTLTASVGNDRSAVKTALKQQYAGAPAEGSLTAAGWCAPSQPVYSYIADYVVDGLVTVPEVSAPRGGLLLTTGPARSSQGTALDDFGFVQTEAQAEAGTVKTCETIVCPDFVDHRLDAIGYCYKIPLLTQKAYPELITDALKFAGVLYAHKVNRRIISDMVALSTPLNATGLGAVFTDTLEALTMIAVKERRKWNIGVNAIMEVKLPEIAREIFRADMSRRNSVSVDAITDQQIDAHFTARRLSVEYVADWQETVGASTTAVPATIQAMIYPAGTFIKAVEDVINLSAVYDAASLSINEYTGVFFEQGVMTIKRGYRSYVIEVPVCVAGRTGANDLTCTGFTTQGFNGAFDTQGSF